MTSNKARVQDTNDREKDQSITTMLKVKTIQ